MDGLLIDTERKAWYVGKMEIAKEYGANLTPQLSIEFTGSNHQLLESQLKEHFGQDFPAQEFMDKLEKYYENYCLNEEITLRPGVIEFLDFLKQNNILIALGTSTRSNLAQIAIQKAGIDNYFDYKVYGNQVKHGKPDPETYLKSVEHFELKPEECIVFEDSSVGAQAAYNGNINLIMVPDVKQPNDLDRKKALAIIDSLQDAIPIIKKLNNI